MIKKIFILDPRKRPTLNEIIEHPFLNNGVTVAKTMHISTLAMRPNKAMMDSIIGRD